MREGGQREGVHFRVLSDDQIDQIIAAAYEVLKSTGARIYEPEAVEILAQAGCTVVGDQTVRFPPELVQEALATAPARFWAAASSTCATPFGSRNWALPRPCG